MAWQVQVSARAAQTYRALEPAIQLEIIEEVAAIAESPAAYLRRYSPLGTPTGLYAHTFDSGTVSGLTITLVFGSYDEDPVRLVLLSIGDVAADPGAASSRSTVPIGLWTRRARRDQQGAIRPTSCDGGAALPARPAGWTRGGARRGSRL